MENNIISEPQKTTLRQKAEEFISEKHSKKESNLTEFDLQKLNHELEVHQIELEMQNEEFKLAKEQTQIAVNRYKDLYDFAPSGYVTISKESLIIGINLHGAMMVGIDRSHLKNRHLAHFVSHATKPIFNLFINNVFQSRKIEVCDVTLFNDNGLPMYVHLSGIVSDNIDQCYITMIDITKHKQLEDELLQREQQYRILAENISDVIWVQDIESTKFRYLSSSIERQLGYSVEEISKQGLSTTIAASSLQGYKSLYEKMIQRFKNGLQDTFTTETQHIHKNGNLIWVEVSIRLSVNQINGRLEANCVSRDITERKLAEETLQDIIDKNPMSIQIVDTEGYTLKTNPSNTQLFGAPPPPDFSIFEDLQRKSKVLEKLILLAKSGEIVHLPDIYYNAHDVIPTVPDIPKWIRAIIFPLKDSHGKPERFVLMHEDITERKEIENLLKQSEKKLSIAYQYTRNLIEVNLDPAVTIDPDGKITDANSAMEKAIGLSRDLLIGTDFCDYFTEPEKARIGYKYVFDQGYVIDYPLTILNISNNNLTDVLYNASVYRDEEGQIQGVFASAHDITERKKIEHEINLKSQELSKLNSEKDKLFSIIAHDLRSPFSGFLGLTQMMAEELPTLTLEEIQKISLAMRNSATNLYKLLGNMLEWSLIQQGLIPYEPKAIKLRETIDESCEITLGQAENKSIKLICNIPENTQVFADNNMLQTVFRNLLFNSIKFSNRGGNISLTAKNIGDEMIEISIKDFGIGMSPELLNDLFKIDIQTNRKGTEGEPSTGLGLIICKEFIERHGGNLWVESEEGKGSTFYFTLPSNIKG
ncbi:MAG: PAS domain S-box protein [bacterium]